MAEKSFEFKLIILSDELKEYIDLTKEISLSNLADAYLRISMNIYKLLKEYHSLKVWFHLLSIPSLHIGS